jgi:hypothetical protein
MTVSEVPCEVYRKAELILGLDLKEQYAPSNVLHFTAHAVHSQAAYICMCRCLYYRTVMLGVLYGTLNVTDAWNTEYWADLYSTNLTDLQCNIALPSLPQKFRGNFFANTSDPLCGEYLQLTSMYPGKGPCFPVFLDTVDYFNRHACHTLLHKIVRRRLLSGIMDLNAVRVIARLEVQAFLVRTGVCPSSLAPS